MKIWIFTLLVMIGFSNLILASEVPSGIISSFVKTKTTYFDQMTHKQVDIYGTGTIVNYKKDSFIITASHVIGGENTKIFIDQKELPVKMLEVDNYWDYAVFKLEGYYPSVFTFNQNKFQIETNLAKNICLIPNIFAENDEPSFLTFKLAEDFQSSTFFEHIISSLGIKPKMSGSPLICNGKLTGVLKAFNRVHDVSYATESYLVFNNFIETSTLQNGKRNNFFIKAKWYLHNEELFRKYNLATGEKYIETVNLLETSYKKNAGGGVRSDGGGSFRIKSMKEFNKKENLYLKNFGFFNDSKQRVYGFKATKYDNNIYFLANETSLVFVNGFTNSSDEFDLSMYDDFDKIEEISQNIDLLQILKKRLENKDFGQHLNSQQLGICSLSLKKDRTIQVNFKRNSEKTFNSYDLKIEKNSNIDQQLVYTYDEKNQIGIDMLGLFFTDLGFIRDNDLQIVEHNSKGFNVEKSNYNLPYVIIKQESKNPLVLPCYFSKSAN